MSSLSDVPLFAGLAPADSAEIARTMTRREFPPQSVIVREGGPVDAAFLVLSGLVAVRRRDRDSIVEFLLSELGPGQMFGEMALLTGKTRTATVVALEPTVCAVLSRDDFARARGVHGDPGRTARAGQRTGGHRLREPVAREGGPAPPHAPAGCRSSTSTKCCRSPSIHRAKGCTACRRQGAEGTRAHLRGAADDACAEAKVSHGAHADALHARPSRPAWSI